MGRFFRVFDRGQNNCYFDSAVKNTNMPQNKFLQHRLVLTSTIRRYLVGLVAVENEEPRPVPRPDAENKDGRRLSPAN